MTTSSVYTFQMTRDQILTAALRKLGVIAEGQTPSSTNLTDGQFAINGAIAQLRSIGMPLWTRVEYTFTPTTSVYAIGTGMTLDTQFPVKLYQAYRTENSTKIPMELISREMTASKYFESIRGTPDQQKKTSRFFRVALKALADLHATGIFHHDITDENLFVQLDDADHLVSVRFIDFGVITSHDGNQHYRIQGDIVYSTASLDSIALVLLYLQGEGLYTVPRSTQWTLEQVSAAVSASSLEPDLQRQTLAQMDLILGEFPIPKILDPAGVGNPGDAEFKDPLAELPQAPPKDPVPE